MAENMKVTLTLTAQDQGAKATVDGLKGSVDGLSSSIDKSAASDARAAAAQDALTASFAQGTAAATRYDAAIASPARTLGQLAEKQTAVHEAFKAGVIDVGEYATASGKLEQQGVKLFAAFEKGTPTFNSLGKSAEGVALNLAAVQREAAIMGGELARGNTAQFEKSLVTMARQAGILQMAMTPVGAAAGIFFGILAGGVAVIEHAESTLDDLNRSIQLTGGYAGLSAQQLAEESIAIGGVTGRYSDAAKALAIVSAQGKLTGGNLETAAAGIVAYADLSGKSVEQAAEQFAKLGEEPYQASVKLTQSMHYLSEATADEIRELEESGRTAEAAALATAAFSDALTDRDAKYRQSLTGLAGLWHDVEGAIDKAGLAMAGFLNQQIDSAKKSPTSMLGFLAQIANGGALAVNLGAAAGASLAGRPSFANTLVGAGPTIPQSQIDDDATNATIAKMAKVTETLEKQAATYDGTRKSMVLYDEQQALIAAGSDKEAAAIIAEAQHQLQLAAVVDAGKTSKKDAAANAKNLAEAESFVNNAIQKGIDLSQDYANAQSGPLLSATKKYNDAIDTLADAFTLLQVKMAGEKDGPTAKENEQWNALVDTWVKVEDQLDLVKAKEDALNAVHVETGNAIDKLEGSWQHELDALGQGSDAYELQTTKIKFETEALRAYAQAVHDAHGQDEVDALKAGLPALLAHADAMAADTVAAKKNAEEMKAWQQIGVQAGNTFADGIGKVASDVIFHFHDIGDVFKSLGQLLENTAEQVVQAIIAQFVKLAIINPILNAIFGGSSGWTQLATLGGGSGGGGGLIGNVLGSYGADGGSGLLGSAGGWVTSNPGLVGSSLAIGGGVLGGIYGYQHAGGGANGLVAGAAYGTAGWVAGTTIAGGVLGGAGAAAAGGSAIGGAAAGASGAFAGAMAAIPVIGWIALAAVAIDYFSGGKLFGTGGKFNFSQVTESISATGASVSAGYDIKGQKALFGGSTHEWHSVDPSQESVDAANQFFNYLLSGEKQFAKMLGTSVADIAAGTFSQNFDKHGNVKSSTTTIAGHTYTGETADQFGQREVDETEINTLDQMSPGLSAEIDKYRANVDQLTALTQALTTAQLAMNGGMKFLALGTNQSTTALLKFAEENGQFGESVDQTIQRMVQAQAQYDQFVKQFAPVTTYANAFQASLGAIRDEYAANVAQANALAEAAGAAGASEADLTNIRKHALDELGQALLALQQNMQGLAVALGYTTQGASPDAIQAQIDAIKNGSGDLESSLGGVGDAIAKVSQRAVDAMNLMLGNLSPLADMEKLQRGLAGLRSGTATVEQVLQIGQRLYGSSQAYTDLYNQVQPYVGRGQQTGGGNSSGQHALTAGEQAKIAALEQDKRDAESAQRHQEALTLAQEIAQYSAVTGQSYEDIAKSQGYDLDKLLGDLGLQTDAQLKTLLDGYKTQQDSAHDDSQDILSAILQLPRALGEVINGTGDGTIVINPPGAQDSAHDPRNHGHSTHASGDRFGRDAANGFMTQLRSQPPGRRNGRQTFPGTGGR